MFEVELLKAVKAAADGAQQLGFHKGLGEVIIGPKGHAEALVGALGFGGEENEGHAREPRVLIKNLKYAVAVEHGHHDVADD